MAKNQEKSTDSKVIFLNLTKETSTPLVSEIFMKRKPYILFGKKNLFPQELIDLADNSSEHESFLEAIEVMTAGSELTFEGDDSEVAKAVAFYESALEKAGLSDVEFRQRVSHDIAKFNGYYLNPTFNRGKKIDSFKPIDFSQIRTDKTIDAKTGKPKSFWRSLDWRYGNRESFTEETQQFQPQEIGAFDAEKITGSLNKNGQILQVKKYKSGTRFYAEPSYLAGIKSIQTSSRIDDFHDNNLKNGMMGNQHVHIFEDLSDPEKRRKIEKDFNKKFAGDDNAGKIIITYSNDKDLVPIFDQIPTNDSHEMLTLLQETVGRKIAIAHRFPPELVGFDVKLGLGGKDKALAMAVALVQDTVISPKQQLFESGIDVMLRTNGINAKTLIVPLIKTENNEEEIVENMDNVDETNLNLGDDISNDGK